MKGKAVVVVVIILGLGVCLFGGLKYLEGYDKVFYTKVDNSSVKELSSDEDMKYEYTLDSYNKNGKKRSLGFKTSRKLKEGAYLSLEVRSFGVHKWEEVKYDDLPKKVQEKLK